MKTLNQHYKARIQSLLKDHQWCRCKGAVSANKISLLGVSEQEGPTGVVYSFLHFDVERGQLVGSFRLCLETENIYFDNEISV